MRIKQIAILTVLLFAFGFTNAQIRIIHVDPSVDQITFENMGAVQENVGNKILCARFEYTFGTIANDATVVSGNLIMNPGEMVTIEWSGLLNNVSSDLGLYTSTAFTDPSAMIDFMQYGASGIGREGIAVLAGLWAAGTFVENPGPFEFTGGATDFGVAFWMNSTSIDPVVRIVDVDPLTDQITIENFGGIQENIGDLFLCARGSYTFTTISNETTVINGSLILNPGATVTIAWTNELNDLSSDLGLYSSTTFADPNDMIDFMQYGAGGLGRESEAVIAGLWSSGTFVENPGPFNFTGGVNDFGAAFWQNTPIDPIDVRLTFIDGEQDLIRIKNFGSSSEDVGALFLCARFNYTFNSIAADVNVIQGNLVLNPGDSVLVHWNNELNDISSDVGLYATIGFGDFHAIIDFMQYGVGGFGRENVAIEAGIWTAGDFVENPGPFQFFGNLGDNGSSFWSNTPPEPLVFDVRITHVNPINDQITIKNFGIDEANVGDLILCARSQYTFGSIASETTLINGSFNVATGDSVTVQWPNQLDDISSDLSLYETTLFTDPNEMVDFMQYGAGGLGRENIAVLKGIWTAGDFVENPGPFQFFGNLGDYGLSFWSNTPPEPLVFDVRITHVNPINDQITIKNFGIDEANIGDLILCARSQYTFGSIASETTLINGSFNVATGDSVTVQWLNQLDDVSSDLSLYETTLFTDPNEMVDFMQYGAGGLGRENIAVLKGIWTAGDFVENPGPFQFFGNLTDYGSAFWTNGAVGIGSVNDLYDQIIIQNNSDGRIKLIIRIKDFDSFKIQLMSTDGKINSVYALNANVSEYVIPTKNLSSGIYLLHFVVDELLLTKKVLLY